MSVFRSAIVGDDGFVDAGYLALFWTMAATVTMIPLIAIAGIVSIFTNPDQAGATLQSVGVAIGAMCTGAGAVIGAVGLFRAGDKPKAATSTTTTTTATTTPDVLKVDVVDMPDPKKPKGKPK